MSGNRTHFQKIEKRRWSDIRARWADYVVGIQRVGDLPDPSLSKFLATPAITLPQPPGGRAVIAGAHQAALREAIFLYQKSMHVARAVEASAAVGLKSWACYQGYHSAYYAAKGVLNLVGVYFPQPEGRQLLLDLFPAPPKRKGDKRLATDEILIHMPCPKLEHRLLWGFFKRILTITDYDNPSSYLTYLSDLDCENIPKPRNRFIYQEDHWPFDDLIKPTIVQSFGFNSSLGAALDKIDEEHPLFLAVVGMVIPAFFRQLFNQLAADIPALAPHVSYIDNPDWQSSTNMVRSYF